MPEPKEKTAISCLRVYCRESATNSIQCDLENIDDLRDDDKTQKKYYKFH